MAIIYIEVLTFFMCAIIIVFNNLFAWFEIIDS